MAGGPEDNTNKLRLLVQDDTLDSSLIDVESISDSHSFYDRGPEFSSKVYVSPVALDIQEVSVLEPSSPSVKSTHSSKRLEWDSGADVGYRSNLKPAVTHLCTIEKMALSSSATRLCFSDDDDRSETLILKIDRLLQRHNVRPTFLETRRQSEHDKSNKVKGSLGSSAASIDTVVAIPQIRITEEREANSDNVIQQEAQLASSINGTNVSEQDKLFREVEGDPASDFEYLTSDIVWEAEASSVKLHDVSNCPSQTESEVTYAADVESNASGGRPQGKLRSDLKTSKTAKINVYRTFRDHLQSLRQYVTQLEKTWELLAESESERERAASSLSSVTSSRTQHSEAVKKKSSKKTSSRSCHSSKTSSSSLIPVEKLNFQDLVSSSSSASHSGSSKLRSKKSCCSHCPDKQKNPEKVEHLGYRPAQMIPQRESVAFFVPLDKKNRADVSGKGTKNNTNLTLEEALQSRRKDFIVHCQERQDLLRRMVDWRRQNSLPDRQDGSAKTSAKPPHLFTYTQLRQQTENLYRRLPEGQNLSRNKRAELNKISMAKRNRLTASVFQKELQQRVLKGQVAFPHTTRLLEL